MGTPKDSGMLRLECKVQHYEWGKIGEESEVALLHSHGSGIEIEQGVPYAELWVGTHDSGPSTVSLGDRRIPLKDWLRQNPHALGYQVLQRWNGDLPFLLKVLSVAKPLSIQAHPDKKMAEQLHRLHPKVYKDANHKPELAVALTDFGALCGFVTEQELKNMLSTVPEVVEVLDPQVVADLLNENSSRASFKQAFTSLMTLEQSVVSGALSKLVLRLARKTKACGLTKKEELVLRLEKQYPGDVGVLSAFFLNYVRLAPGQAIFLGANEPHAYLYGECIECMAASDNVVRAGLTPKFRDVQTLCSMLTYKQGFPEIMDGTVVDRFTRRYSAPCEEFEVDCITIPGGETASVATLNGPSVFLVHQGLGLASSVAFSVCLQRGSVFFVMADRRLDLSAFEKPLRLFRAGVSSQK